MRQILTILLIGLLALVSVPRAGMTHDVAIGAQEVASTSHHLGCPTCPEMSHAGTPNFAHCTYGTLCLLFPVTETPDHDASRMILPVGYPRPAAPRVLSRAPSLDLPPPRIGPANA